MSILNTRSIVALEANLKLSFSSIFNPKWGSFGFSNASQKLPEKKRKKRRRCSYRLPNIKHLLCLESAILGSWLFCCFVWLVIASFSMAFMNLRKCLMYSGYVSRLQWPPPLTHRGSYFSFESSHNRFPWDQSTMSSFVPCF